MHPLTLTVRDLGLVPYDEALALQKEIAAERMEKRGEDVVLLLCHPPVVTVGRAARAEPDPDTGGIPVRRIERGGKATYHGPGQIVAYPVLRLDTLDLGVGDYMRSLEGGVLRALAAFDVEGSRKREAPGVWVGERKIASIGAAVRRGVAFHGLAWNLSPEPAGFSRIRPCGLDPSVVTSLEEVLDRVVDWIDAKRALVEGLSAEWGVALSEGAGDPS